MGRPRTDGEGGPPAGAPRPVARPALAALAAGVPAKVVSERLGHANIGITMDTYSHVMPQLDREAANKVADLIFGNDEEGPSDGS